MWREQSHAPPYADPEPDEHGLTPAGDQAHTIEQGEAADWARECLVLPGDPATRDDGLASMAAYRSHLTPLCQLAGVTEAAARVLRLAHGYLEVTSGNGSLTVQPWLFRVTALRAGGDPGHDDRLGSRDELWAGVCDAPRFFPFRGDGDERGDGRPVLGLVGDETVLRLTALFTAAAKGNEDDMAALVDGDLSWPSVQERMFIVLARYAWAAGNMFTSPAREARSVLRMSVFGTGTVPDLAEALRRERPELDLDRFFTG